MSGLAKSQPMAKKLKMLRQRELERQMRVVAEVDSWFNDFDTNKDGKLQRDEVCPAKLITGATHPHLPYTCALTHLTPTIRLAQPAAQPARIHSPKPTAN